MNLTRNQVIIIGIIGFIVLFFILVFLGIIPGLKKDNTDGTLGPSGNQYQINFWGVVEASDSSAIQAIIDEYSKIDKSVTIAYRQFDNAAAYEKALLNALAIGQAPDILMFHSTWLPKHYDKIKPFPETTFPLSQLQQLFPTVVEQDFSANKIVYALPLYIDTLALIYNKDVFDTQAITSPPKTWLEFKNLIPQLRQINNLNQITRAAAAIGGSEKSIDSASDLLNLLMMQFGNKILNQQNEINLGLEALSAFNFYLQFANPSSPYYTWNDSLVYSLDSFSQGQTAVIFDYASQIPLIKGKNPYLNIGISSMPQFFDITQCQPNVSQQFKCPNYADYWGLAVSNEAQKPDLAWKFILYATANPEASDAFLQAAKRPPALGTLIEKYKNDPDFGVFSRQALTSRSWPQPDSASIKQIFSDMIESVLSGRLTPENALQQAENEINGL